MSAARRCAAGPAWSSLVGDHHVSEMGYRTRCVTQEQAKSSKRTGFLRRPCGRFYRTYGCRPVGLQGALDHPRFRVCEDGPEITGQIRSAGVGEYASKISVYPEVRAALVAFQRRIAQERGIVVEGRDVQTVVCPDADVKVFLTASADERARRRWLELRTRHPEVGLEAITKQVQERDARDQNRAASPLRAAEDATTINTDGLTPDQSASQIIALL